MRFNFFTAAKFVLFLSALYVGVVVSSSLFPFIVGKYVWFRVSVDVALILTLLGLVLQQDADRYLMRLRAVIRSPLSVAVLVFVVVFLLAGFFGVDPALSFWSNFERGEGGIQILHLGLFFFLLSLLLEAKEDWERLFRWALWGGALMVAYGIFTGFGYQGFIGPQFGDPSYRFQGTIGNPAYVAAFVIFLFFYIAYLFHVKRRDRKLVSFGSAVLALITLAFLAAFYLAATRGAFLGLAAAIAAFLGYFAFSHRVWRKWLITAGILLAALVFTLIQFKDAPLIKNLPGSRIFDISFSTATFQHRTIMWGIALSGFKERPVLGWGPENYIQVFDRHFNTRYFKPGEAFGAWFDRAHSVVFDYLAETGALGLLSYLAIFAVFYFQFFAMVRARKENRSIFVESLLFALPVAYFVQGIVLFDVLTIYYNWYLFLAFSLFYFRSVESEPGTMSPPPRGAERHLKP
ncbi:MAG: O-antigen ligase family protein [Patescibacteria group bacterium]